MRKEANSFPMMFIAVGSKGRITIALSESHFLTKKKKIFVLFPLRHIKLCLLCTTQMNLKEIANLLKLAAVNMLSSVPSPKLYTVKVLAFVINL